MLKPCVKCGDVQCRVTAFRFAMLCDYCLYDFRKWNGIFRKTDNDTDFTLESTKVALDAFLEATQ